MTLEWFRQRNPTVGEKRFKKNKQFFKFLQNFVGKSNEALAPLTVFKLAEKNQELETNEERQRSQASNSGL